MVTLNQMKKKFDRIGRLSSQLSKLNSEFSREEREFFGFNLCDFKDGLWDDRIASHFAGEEPCDFVVFLDLMDTEMKRRQAENEEVE